VTTAAASEVDDMDNVAKEKELRHFTSPQPDKKSGEAKDRRSHGHLAQCQRGAEAKILSYIHLSNLPGGRIGLNVVVNVLAERKVGRWM